MPTEPRGGSITRGARCLLALIGTAAFIVGCGDDGYGRRYPVSGNVRFKGEPLKEGAITFTPADQNTGRAASGFIVDGAYSLTTVDDEDGALPGSYQVSITADDVDLTKVEAAAQKGGGAAFREDLVAKAPRKSSIPRKYNLPNTSGLSAVVKEESNQLDFNLED